MKCEFEWFKFVLVLQNFIIKVQSENEQDNMLK